MAMPRSISLRAAARKLLSAFKVPTVWLLVDSDEDIPRGTTGKVDVRRLRACWPTRMTQDGSDILRSRCYAEIDTTVVE